MLIFKLLEFSQQFRDVAHEHTHGNRQQNDAEKFAQHIYERLAANALHYGGITQHEIDDNDVQHQSDEDIRQAVQRP